MRRRLVLLAGRYEGIDQRLLEREVDEEVAIGDFVVSGGELPALMLIDAILRLRPGVLNDAESAVQDSFAAGLLDCPHYTRPDEYDGKRVPEVLLSGHHEAIRAWRLQQALGRTWERRPDLPAGAGAVEGGERVARGVSPRTDAGVRPPVARRQVAGSGGSRPSGSGRHSAGQQAARIRGRPALRARSTTSNQQNGERSMDIIATLEKEEIERLGKKIPVFAPGDTVIVNVSVVEGERKRVQAYEGVVIAKRNRGLNSSFVVRKISSGEGVERTFQTYSPLIAGIEVKRKGDVRRAKLYYLRDRSGKSARIREKLAHTHKEKQG